MTEILPVWTPASPQPETRCQASPLLFHANLGKASINSSHLSMKELVQSHSDHPEETLVLLLFLVLVLLRVE